MICNKGGLRNSWLFIWMKADLVLLNINLGFASIRCLNKTFPWLDWKRSAMLCIYIHKYCVYLWCQKLDKTVGRQNKRLYYLYIIFMPVYVYHSCCEIFLTSWYDAWGVTYFFHMYICYLKSFFKKHQPLQKLAKTFLMILEEVPLQTRPTKTVMLKPYTSQEQWRCRLTYVTCT